MIQVYEGGEVRTLDLGIKSPQRIPRDASPYSRMTPSGPKHSPPYLPEADLITGQRPTVCHTAYLGGARP